MAAHRPRGCAFERRRRSSRLGLVLAARYALVLPSVAGSVAAAQLEQSSAGPPPYGRYEAALVDLDTPLIISDRRADVECGDLYGDPELVCVFDVSYRARLGEGSAPTIFIAGGYDAVIDGQARRDVPIAPGQTISVRVMYRRPIYRSRGGAVWADAHHSEFNRYLLPDGITARHLLLAATIEGDPPTQDQLVMPLFALHANTTFEGPVAFRLRVHDGLVGGYGGRGIDATGNHFEVHRGDDAEHSFRIGGPILGFGAVFDGDFRMRAGYQLGLGDFSLAQLTIETDFQVNATLALSVGLVSPGGFIVILPSLEAAVGAVVRVAPDVRGGLRLMVGGNVLAGGVQASFDYWPVDGTWEIVIMGTVSG